MPIDKTAARKRIQGARYAYARGIHSEFIQAMANELEQALNDLDQTAVVIKNAENEASRMARELDEEKTHYRKLRENSIHTEEMLSVLKIIAHHGKGAQKKAAELLTKMGIAVEISTKQSATKEIQPEVQK